MTASDQESTYARLESLPYADGEFENVPRIKEKIGFTLAKDPSKKVTLITGHSASDFPKGLLECAWEEFNYVVEEGRTYPHYKPVDYEGFLQYAFVFFFTVLVEVEYTEDMFEQPKSFWSDKLLGFFYIKPNYIGRCSHVCNAGFVVNHHKRGLGLGKEMGRKYLTLAPRLGFVYSVFNLVFETNTASLRIWDSLGFSRIGYVKNVAVLKGESKLTGAVMFGKDLV